MLRTTVLCSTALIAAPLATAAPVIDWGPGTDLVTSNVGAAAIHEDTDTLNLGTAAFDAGDYASAPLSPTVYAAIRSFTGDGSTIETGATIQINSNNSVADGLDAILFSNGRVQPDTSNDGTTNWGIAFWQVASQAAAVESITIGGGKNAGTSETRAVIRLGSDFYVSKDLGSFSQADASTVGDAIVPLTITDMSATDWFAYDPASNFTNIGAAASLSDFTGLTGAGFLGRNANAGAEFRSMALSEFSVTLVPEPASIALLATGGLLMLGRRRTP